MPIPISNQGLRRALKAWSSSIPNGPWVGELDMMALSMGDRELDALRRALEAELPDPRQGKLEL